MTKKDCAIDGRLAVEQDRTIPPPPKNSRHGATSKVRLIAAIYGIAIASLLACSRKATPIVTPAPPVNPTPNAKTVGLILNKKDAFGGYTLFNKRRTKTMYLIDNQGREVHRWELGSETTFARLLENGNLLTLLNTDQGRYVQEVDRNGNTLWECAQDSLHHDALKMPNGNVLLLSRQYKTEKEASAAGANPDFIDTNSLTVPHIVEAKITGPANCEIVWEWSAWDHLIQDFDTSKANYGNVAEHPELIDLNFRLSEVDPWDWIHSNGIDYNPELDQIILSPRNFSEVWIIDHSTTTTEAAATAAERAARGATCCTAGVTREPIAPGLPMTSNSSGRIISNGLPPVCRDPETSSFSTMASSSRISGVVIHR